jgi:hypothetical protein
MVTEAPTDPSRPKPPPPRLTDFALAKGSALGLPMVFPWSSHFEILGRV